MFYFFKLDLSFFLFSVCLLCQHACLTIRKHFFTFKYIRFIYFIYYDIFVSVYKVFSVGIKCLISVGGIQY